MEVHQTREPGSNTVVMWSDPSNPSSQDFRVCSKSEIKEGDYVSVGSKEHPRYYLVEKVVESRMATVPGYDYISMIAKRTNIIQN